jgi:hypothetical protein
MARAFIGGKEWQVRVDRDLGENWAVTVVPPAPRRGEPERGALIVKLQGNDRPSVLKGGLEILQKAGHLERFELDAADLPPPEPEKPAAPAPAEKPAAPVAEKPASEKAPAAPKPPADKPAT